MQKKIKVVLLILLNLGLLVSVFGILSFYNIVKVSFPFFSSPITASASPEDPFLIERESLQKQWKVLAAKENYIAELQNNLNSKNALLEEKLKEANKQIEAAKNMQKNQQEEIINKNNQEKNARNLAQKIISVPPLEGASILNDMDSLVALEVIKMIDKIAQEEGQQSSSAYILSLMEKDKRKEVVALLADYPTDINTLNPPEKTS